MLALRAGRRVEDGPPVRRSVLACGASGRSAAGNRARLRAPGRSATPHPAGGGSLPSGSSARLLRDGAPWHAALASAPRASQRSCRWSRTDTVRTLVPEVAIDVEVRDERIKLLRFTAPEPGRTIGLAWRRTSPRKVDFIALGQIAVEAMAPLPVRSSQNR